MKKAVLITVFAAALIIVVIAGFCISVPIVNDLHAKKVADSLAALPLPENTRIVEQKSIAAKLTGNGNGMQYMGALLLESGLSAEELQAHYADCYVQKQNGQRIEAAEHGRYSFRSSVNSDEYYIVYAFGGCDSALIELYSQLDLRGH